ncbi:MAG: hypothetical protein ACTMUB_04070 [cyanobacterium endosymbiont of Rhopalodia musculus]|uniref:hypothetical protein n=1 Tax=cyanobacterium endosymbiont of Epithemia clementina EcSB TaxID=3034674 RepID=UPI0024818E4C|nr:hypothetical protein [cyanobacterium endosymbiont of Epithemia clementina EcSB]WGT67363.1 hypothetical protein P3F56_09210 [cyanobacterium endosymbiont of Epithemia clementina EcSB]
MMSINLPLRQLFCILISSLGTVGGIPQIILAQSVDVINEENNYQNNEQDPAGELGNIFNPMDLMHRSNLQRSRNAGDFAEDTNNNLNKAAQEFKLIQQRRLQQESSEPFSNSTSN